VEQLCQHILDLAENSTAAGAGLVEIAIVEDLAADRLTVEIRDDGKGLPEQVLAEVNGPLSECSACGLGLTLFSRSCQDAAGGMVIENLADGGAAVRGVFTLSEEGRESLGDLNETFVTMVMGSPGVDWVLRHRKVRQDGREDELHLDTRAIRTEVGLLPVAHPEVIRRIRKSLRQQEAKLKD
jgi:Histidine kinase-, DNA gyrase B-, and HSP90-like ATPase